MHSLAYPLALVLAFYTVSGALRVDSYGPIAGSPPQILPCDPTSTAQQWLVNEAPGGGWQLTATIVYANRSCLEINPQLLPGINVTLVNNHCGSPPPPAQTFVWNKTALTAVPQAFVAGYTPYAQCVALAQGGTAAGTQVWAENCTTAPSQQWEYDNSTKLLKALGAPGMCLDVGSARAPCAPGSDFASLPYCNQTLAVEERVEDMLARMSFHEALQQTQANSAGAPSIGLPPWGESDFTHGAGSPFTWTYDATRSHGLVVYPAASSVGQSFNRTLWREVGLAVGDEQRSQYNAGLSSLIGWSPNINIARASMTHCFVVCVHRILYPQRPVLITLLNNPLSHTQLPWLPLLAGPSMGEDQ